MTTAKKIKENNVAARLSKTQPKTLARNNFFTETGVSSSVCSVPRYRSPTRQDAADAVETISGTIKKNMGLRVFPSI